VPDTLRQRLFDIDQYRIPLSEQESRVISLICLLFSFSDLQLLDLTQLQPNEPIWVPDPDSLQSQLEDLSEVRLTKVKKNNAHLFQHYPAQVFQLVESINPTLMQRSLDEANLETTFLAPLI